MHRIPTFCGFCVTLTSSVRNEVIVVVISRLRAVGGPQALGRQGGLSLREGRGVGPEGGGPLELQEVVFAAEQSG